VAGGRGTPAPPGAAASPGAAPAGDATQAAAADEGVPDAAPPPSTLGHAGQAQAGQLGSYTWAAGGRVAHADAPGIPLPDAALAVPAGAALAFALDGAPPPSALTARAHALAGQPVRELGGRRFLERPAASAAELPARLAGQRAEITAAVPAGEYALVVEVQWRGGEGPPQEASYSFRVVVR
jgi:hypothetical protein